jgi:hypothetical protein
MVCRRYIGLEESVQQLAGFMFDYTKLNRWVLQHCADYVVSKTEMEKCTNMSASRFCVVAASPQLSDFNIFILFPWAEQDIIIISVLQIRDPGSNNKRRGGGKTIFAVVQYLFLATNFSKLVQ